MANSNISSLGNTESEELKLKESFTEQMAQLCLNADFSDITIIVENQRLPAHRAVLAARSEYFRKLIFGNFVESKQSEIKLEDVHVEPFKDILKFIYTGRMLLTEMSDENILSNLELANQYGFTELKHYIGKYLLHHLTVDNICSILNAAVACEMEKLTDTCSMYMDHNAVAILDHESFCALTKEPLQKVLSRDSFFAPEIQIFLAACNWSNYHQLNNIDSVISLIRFSLMSTKDLVRVVRPSGFFNPDKLWDVFEEQTNLTCLPYRGELWPEENVATLKFESKTIQGSCATLNPNSACQCNIKTPVGVTVELGTICIINHIEVLFELCNRLKRYSYYIEVSANSINWDLIIDYSKYPCGSTQFLYFKERPVLYIRIICTNPPAVNRIASIKVMHTASIPKSINGFVEATSNVALYEMGADVIEGTNTTGLLTAYTHRSDFTYTNPQTNRIVIQLGQPYIIGTMRLRLSDDASNFYIETSLDRVDWAMVVDKRNSNLRSWQDFVFTPRPMMFIRLVRTNDSELHCAFFECPSSVARCENTQALDDINS